MISLIFVLLTLTVRKNMGSAMTIGKKDAGLKCFLACADLIKIENAACLALLRKMDEHLWFLFYDRECLNHRGICQYRSNYCSGSYTNHRCGGPRTRHCCLLPQPTKMLIVRAIIVATLISSVAAGPWGQICAGNPMNKARGCDGYGCGYYTAPRKDGRRKHLGVDVICRDGSTVYAPFSGMIERRINPHGGSSVIDNGVQLRGSGFCVQMFYIRPVKYRGRINKGQTIGEMMPMQRVYPGITSHVHVQKCNRFNVTRYL
ncbi:unnamed protein product [Eretmochelys imbricata]